MKEVEEFEANDLEPHRPECDPYREKKEGLCCGGLCDWEGNLPAIAQSTNLDSKMWLFSFWSCQDPKKELLKHFEPCQLEETLLLQVLCSEISWVFNARRQAACYARLELPVATCLFWGTLRWHPARLEGTWAADPEVTGQRVFLFQAELITHSVFF